MMHGREKSDSAIVAVKPTNKAVPTAAEPVEPRAGANGNARQQSTHRTQGRERVAQALERVRQAARQRKKERFTALLHHISIDCLRMAFFALKRDAASGVDGLTWPTYRNLTDLHERVHRGACRALPSRRTYIPKADGKQIVQRATAAVLNAIYEEDFLGFSYGFRPKRGQHNALDALVVGITSRRVNFIFDADVASFFDSVSKDWLRHEATGDMILMRYADDIVVGFEHEADARRFWDDMRKRFEEFSLSLNPDKTRLIVNKRPRLPPQSLGRSIARPADRRRDPMPINTLIRRMSVENPLWGAPRIHGELRWLFRRTEIVNALEKTIERRSQTRELGAALFLSIEGFVQPLSLGQFQNLTVFFRFQRPDVLRHVEGFGQDGYALAVLVEERFPSVLVVDRTFVMHAKTDVRDCRERSCVEDGVAGVVRGKPETQRRGAERRPQPERHAALKPEM
ncbi:Reverse transcriptase (RNA-dependent DNA polymerase) [Bradyrhizobium erythrophlei]|nr:Reverse transcriptase (RNA-dependent DNA polymerase) [Bradyrhizobium erythrophlei]